MSDNIELLFVINENLPVRKSTEWPATVKSLGNSNDPKWSEQISVELRLHWAKLNQASLAPTIFSMHNYLDWEKMAKQIKLPQNQWANEFIWILSYFNEYTNIESAWSFGGWVALPLPLGWLGLSVCLSFFGGGSADRRSISILFVWFGGVATGSFNK